MHIIIQMCINKMHCFKGGGLFMETKIYDVSIIGTQPSGIALKRGSLLRGGLLIQVSLYWLMISYIKIFTCKIHFAIIFTFFTLMHAHTFEQFLH